MKIGLLGNMNNNFFALMRTLRDAGIDAELVCFAKEQAHFKPENDTWSNRFNPYIKTIFWTSPYDLITTSGKKIKESLASYDYLIGCGMSPAYVYKAGRSLDVFIPYGDDLYYDTQYQITSPRVLLQHNYFVYLQRKGLKHTTNVLMEQAIPELEAYFTPFIPYVNRLLYSCPMLYAPDYSWDALAPYFKDSLLYPRLLELKAKYDFLMVHHARHRWCFEHSNREYKGTDKLIKGFAQFCKENPDKNPCLILFEYGSDVPQSKELIRSLGIENAIFWFQTMPRREIMILLHHADLCTGEFGHSHLASGVIIESLCTGKPLLHFLDRAFYANCYEGNLYPCLEANSEEAIVKSIAKVYQDPENCKKMGQEAKAWFLKNLIEKPISVLIETSRSL